jgi:methyltransferase-like protein
MAAGVVEWRLTPVPFTTTVAERPAVTPLARLQASQGYKVTNLRGESVTLDEIHRQALRLLDGTRERPQVTEALLTPVRSGELVLQRDSDKQPVTDEAEMRRLLGPALDKVLTNLAKRALLLGGAAR